MQNKNEGEVLRKIINFAKKEGGLTEAVENEFLAYFGEKGKKILEVLRNKRLHKLKIDKNLNFWLVEGKDKEYLIIDNNFCECYDFQIRVLIRKERNYCYHILAKMVGDALKLYDIRTLTDEEYNHLLKEKIKDIKLVSV